MIVAIDFDGTCVTHDYPEVGKDIGAVEILKQLVDNDHQLMLWTMRGNKPTDDGINTLQAATDWFERNDIPLWGVNENPDQTQEGWTNSNKQYAQLYIDDAALGCPLNYNPNYHSRPFVDWAAVERMLIQLKLI